MRQDGVCGETPCGGALVEDPDSVDKGMKT